MSKELFISELSKGLDHFPKKEKDKCLRYYEEMITDRIEDGMEEEMAVKAMGDIEDIIKEVTNALPLTTLISTKINKSLDKSNGNFMIVVLILGFPLWFPLLIAGLVLTAVLYFVFFALIFAFYACLFAFLISGVIYIFGGIVFIFTETLAIGLATTGAGLVVFSLGILLFKPAVAGVNMLIQILKTTLKKAKSLFIKKERNI